MDVLETPQTANRMAPTGGVSIPITEFRTDMNPKDQCRTAPPRRENGRGHYHDGKS
jgi:hypothetical protein